MRKTIGIIGGMGPLATADLFKKIVLFTDASSDSEHIRIFIDDNTNIPDRTKAILEGRTDPLPFMSDSVAKLEGCGADCLIMPCNTAHYFLPELKKVTHIPFISMLEETARLCFEMFPGKTAGLLATTGTLSSGVYEKPLEDAHVPFILPADEDRKRLMSVIYDGVKKGRDIEEFRDAFTSVIRSMKNAGADYFILGCTELPIVAEQLKLTVPVIDPTEALAKAAIRYCGYGVKDSL